MGEFRGFCRIRKEFEGFSSVMEVLGFQVENSECFLRIPGQGLEKFTTIKVIEREFNEFSSR